MSPPTLLLATTSDWWNFRDQLHSCDWYEEFLRSDWFSPLRPYWEEYYLDCLVCGLLALLLLFSLRGLWRLFRRLVARRQTMAKSGAATARDLLSRGEPLLAAEAYLGAGMPGEAESIFADLGIWARAGQAAEAAGRLQAATEHYVKARDTVSAVRVLRADGQVDEAVRLLQAEERGMDAAELLREAGRPQDAAELLRLTGLYTRAAGLYREAGESLLAAECLQALVASPHAGFTDEERDMLLDGAGALNGAGRRAESAEMLAAAGEWEGAARRFEDLGDWSRAVDCWERQGQLRRAIDKCREPGRRLDLLQKLRQTSGAVRDDEWAAALAAAGQHEAAAAVFEAAGDLAAAVEARRAAGDPAEAAAACARAGEHAEAAALFEEAGDLAAAREQHLLAGDRRTAAKVGQRAALFFEAGSDFFALGDMARAIDSLQQVPESHPQLRQAQSLLGQAFARLGDRDMARRMHERAVVGLSVGRENLDLFYRLARFLEESTLETDRSRACQFYEEMLAVHYTFQDAKNRLERLRQK